MKRWLQFAAFALPCSLLAMAPAPDTASANKIDHPLIDGQPVNAGRLLVRLKPDSFAGRAQRPANLAQLPGLATALPTLGATGSRPLITDATLDDTARRFGLDRDYVVELAAGEDPAQRLADWAARPEVETAEPDWIVQAMLVPNDSYFTQQWALRNTGQWPGSGTPDVDIDADEAWNITTGSADVTIAIIDTGVDLNHPDLQGKIVAGWDFVNDDASADDDHMHGTACASLAAAMTNNGTGVSGVNWLARIMPLKALDATGNGSTTDIIAAVDWARTHGADVISMSLGGGSYSSTFNNAINAASSAGLVVVSAAGNDNESTISYPARYANSMAVGALSPCNERKAPDSCDGEYWWGSNYGTGLDVMAPGVWLRSATINSYIYNMNGTSGATPHVAGVAALVKGRNPLLSSAEIRDIIRDSAVDMGAAGWDNETGYGRLNAFEALLLTPTSEPCDIDFDGPALDHDPLVDLYEEVEPAPVRVTATDDCGVDGVLLRWQVDGGAWSEAPMDNAAGDEWVGALPAQAFGSTVHYQLVATDGSPNANQSLLDHSYLVIDPCQIDQTAPAITLAMAIPDTDDVVGPYLGLVAIDEPCGFQALSLTFTVDGGLAQPGLIQNAGGDSYLVQIPGLPEGGAVSWTVLAIDDSPYHNYSLADWGFTVTPPDPCLTDDAGPQIAHDPLADREADGQPVPVEATVEDPCGVAAVNLRWQVDGGEWSLAPMADFGGGLYGGELPSYPGGSEILYRVEAVDGSANANVGQVEHGFSLLLPPPAATTVQALWTGDSQVTLSWSAAENAQQYRVESAPGADGPWTEEATVAALEWTATVAGDELRIFRVVALN